MYTDRMKDYTVTEDGIVISHKHDDDRELRQGINGKGYKHVSVNGRTTTVHRLVAWKYCEGYKEGLQVNHKDGDKFNNHKDNLEWCDAMSNCKHAMMNIVTERRLYSNEQIKEIRRLYKVWKIDKDRRYTSPQLAKMYGVSKVTIMNIINGDRYDYV